MRGQELGFSKQFSPWSSSSSACQELVIAYVTCLIVAKSSLFHVLLHVPPSPHRAFLWGFREGDSGRSRGSAMWVPRPQTGPP